MLVFNLPDIVIDSLLHSMLGLTRVQKVDTRLQQLNDDKLQLYVVQCAKIKDSSLFFIYQPTPAL
jgi:hypothetical protein